MSVSSASGSIPLRPRSLSASSGSNSVQLAQAARRVNSVAGSVPLTSTTQQPVQGISGSVSVLPQATQPSPSTVSPVGSNIAVQATRAPNIAIVANRVQRAVAPVFVSTHAFGTKLDRSSTSEQQAELQACFDKIHDKLIQESLLNGRETGVRVHFERCVVSYIDEHGVPQEKSILPKMESDHEFNDLVEDLARCAREILGKPGYTIHSLKDMAKRPASNGPTSTFRRSGSYGQYQTKQRELATLQGQLGLPNANKKQLKEQIARLESEISAFTLQSKVPTTVAESKTQVKAASNLTAHFDARTAKAEENLTKLSSGVKEYLEELETNLKTAKNPSAGTAIDQAAINRLEAQIKELKDFQTSLKEVDEFALTMALAYCPQGDPSNADLVKAADALRRATRDYYQNKIREHQQELHSKGKPVKVDEYQKDFADDVGALAFAAVHDEEQHRVLYGKYCETHMATMKSKNMTETMLRFILDDEKGRANAKDQVLSALSGDVKAQVLRRWNAPSAPAAAPTP